jgi:phosphoenolpyruvate-protein kinase (PTS system EI component)
MNEAIKNAINKHLKKNNVINESFYSALAEDAEKLKSLRNDVDNSLIDLKIKIIKSNLHLLVDKIFKEDKEGVINILKNTKDRTVFFDFTENFSKFLILGEEYIQNYEFNSPDLADIKETFALKDEELHQLINEINLDNK